MYSYENGRYVKSEDLTIPVKSDMLGTFRGYRIFTVCKTVHNRVIHIDDHVDRLISCAKKIRMDLPYDRAGLKAQLLEIVNYNISEGCKEDLCLHVFFSGGSVVPGTLRPSAPANLYILTVSVRDKIPSNALLPIRLATYPYQRDFPEVKLLDYVAGIVAFQEVADQFDAQDILYVTPANPNCVLEGTTFNFFAVKENTIYTPPCDGKILQGIVRRKIVELVRELGLQLKETTLDLSALTPLDEAFITSSVRDLIPVAKINADTIGTGDAGPVTRQLIEAYRDKYHLLGEKEESLTARG
jgi:branched-chain amino acid aminotransferase